MQSSIRHQNHHQRRSTTRFSPSPSPTPQLHQNLPQIFSGRLPSYTSSVPNHANPAEDEPSSSSEDGDARKPTHTHTASSFLAPPSTNPSPAQTSYSRIMHAHTTSQMSSPKTGTIPSYARTMHAFTLNQMDHMASTNSQREREPQSSSQPPKSNRNSKGNSSKNIQTITPTHKTHLLAQPTSPPLNLKLPPTSSPSTSPFPQTQAQKPNEETPRNPTNTPEPDGGDEGVLPLPSPVSSLLARGSRSTMMLAEELRACERELERRFESLGGVGVGGEGFEGFGGRAEGRDFTAVRF